MPRVGRGALKRRGLQFDFQREHLPLSTLLSGQIPFYFPAGGDAEWVWEPSAEVRGLTPVKGKRETVRSPFRFLLQLVTILGSYVHVLMHPFLQSPSLSTHVNCVSGHGEELSKNKPLRTYSSLGARTFFSSVRSGQTLPLTAMSSCLFLLKIIAKINM